ARTLAGGVNPIGKIVKNATQRATFIIFTIFCQPSNGVKTDRSSLGIYTHLKAGGQDFIFNGNIIHN
ncbi:MAG: hypothetical protein WBD58_04600, partial [Geitlerinemataceae cyanobacterium]